MLNKWLMLGGLVLASLMCSSDKAQAQQINCGGDSIQYGGGNSGYTVCVPIQQPQQPQYNPGSGSRSAPNPRPVIEEYGLGHIVVAWHPKATDVWATWNQRSVGKATQTVLSACKQVMGEGCGIVKSGWNGTVAIVRDRTNGLWQGWGETPQQAREVALQSCKTLKEGCEVLHTFTSEPLKQRQNFKSYQEYFKYQEDPAFDVSKSYLPGNTAKADPNRGFFAIAWTGLSSQTWPNLVAASGYPTLEEAEKVAIARCQAESKQPCVSFGIADDRKYPMFAVYLHGQNQAYWYSNTTENNLEKMADEHCRERGVTCQKVGLFDARRSSVSIHPIKK